MPPSGFTLRTRPSRGAGVDRRYSQSVLHAFAVRIKRGAIWHSGLYQTPDEHSSLGGYLKGIGIRNIATDAIIVPVKPNVEMPFGMRPVLLEGGNPIRPNFDVSYELGNEHGLGLWSFTYYTPDARDVCLRQYVEREGLDWDGMTVLRI